MKKTLIITVIAGLMCSCESTKEAVPVLAGPVEFSSAVGVRTPILPIGIAVGVLAPEEETPVLVEPVK